MERPENRDSRDAALELGRTRNRLLLRESLVRTRLVVEAHELGDEASEVVLAEEEDVVGVLGDETGAAAHDVGGQPHHEPKDLDHAARCTAVSVRMAFVARTAGGIRTTSVSPGGRSSSKIGRDSRTARSSGVSLHPLRPL